MMTDYHAFVHLWSIGVGWQWSELRSPPTHLGAVLCAQVTGPASPLPCVDVAAPARPPGKKESGRRRGNSSSSAELLFFTGVVLPRGGVPWRSKRTCCLLLRYGVGPRAERLVTGRASTYRGGCPTIPAAAPGPAFRKTKKVPRGPHSFLVGVDYSTAMIAVDTQPLVAARFLRRKSAPCSPSQTTFSCVSQMFLWGGDL